MLLHDIKEIRGGRVITLDGGPGYMSPGSDLEGRRKQKEFLKTYYPDYNPVRHDVFVERYNKEIQAKAEKEYRVNRGLDSVNHLGEKEYQTYAAWRAACKQANPNVQFEGDKDICQAKPGVGEWGGDKGVIYTKDSDESSESISPEEFLKGIEVEMEHNDITHGDPVTTAKIVLAHLKEMPDYYSRVEKMEGNPTKDGGVGSGTKGHITMRQKMMAAQKKRTEEIQRSGGLLQHEQDYIVGPALKAIKAGKDPHRSLADAFENENFHGDRPDIVADRHRIINAMNQKYKTGIDPAKIDKMV